MTNWDYLEGKRVNGLYLGLWPYSGLVIESRVKYGGGVVHTVKLDESITVYGATRSHVLVAGSEINRILDTTE